MTLSRQNFSNLANAGIAGASKKDLIIIFFIYREKQINVLIYLFLF
jgi:hypothetical protein